MSKKISFTDFVNYVEEHLLEGWHEERQIKKEEVQKNNGKMYTGVVLFEEGKNIAPTLYLEDAYEMYCDDLELDETIQWMRLYYEEAEKSMDHLLVDDIFRFSSIQDRIIARIVNYERNKEILKECPHIRIHDLAVTFRCLMDMGNKSVSSTLVNNSLMETWEVSIHDILLIALKNTELLFPPMITSIDSLFDEDMGENQQSYMYVASNKMLLNGASILLYPGVFQGLAEELACNFYILPSSVHELILIPDICDMDYRELKSFVKEVNETVVDEEEVLSNSVYYYDRSNSKIACCG